ncbi:hypothetical protein [Saccharococcus sp. Marseille-Q5394]|uniref:hypothetical protein n=1 Tax=Saccharococcus sp. Marseille-Q5394 TaxID=2972778 RepID=UPI0021C95C48|nr:hypothetical protein [Saccharococcus sp. Marseille-Q5394]
MTIEDMKNFLDGNNYDIRINKNGRWIDQKCAWDVVCFVADCIIVYLEDGGSQPFISPHIWHSQYAVDNVQEMFSKPDPTAKSTLDEYNKLFRQPMKMLAAAGVLNEEKKGASILFSVNRMDILEFIALREKNAREFLCNYIVKTLKDSDLWDAFELFFEKQTVESFRELKNTFTTFSIDNTPINTPVEASRIFSKVLNPLAFRYKKKGTDRGFLSKDIITLDKIAYNQSNWRDEYSGKSKTVARGDYIPPVEASNTYSYRVERAKKTLRRFNDKYNNSQSEVVNERYDGIKASYMHHIFPQYSHPEIADYTENLIALTSEQHYTYAHPDGNTRLIDEAYQYTCLIEKTDRIKRNLESKDQMIIYTFDNFKYVLDKGFKSDVFSTIEEHDFTAILNKIDEFKP